MVLERDPYSEVCTMAKQVLDTIYNKMVLVQRDRKGSEVFRSLSQAEGKSVSAPGSPAKPSFLLGEPPQKPQHHPASQLEQVGDWWPAFFNPGQQTCSLRHGWPAAIQKQP